MRTFRRKSNTKRIAVICVCVALLAFCGYYMIRWNLERDRILKNNAGYSALYDAATEAPAPESTPLMTAVPTSRATPVITAASTLMVTPVSAAAATATPPVTAAAVPSVSPVSASAAAPKPTAVSSPKPADPATAAPVGTLPVFQVVNDEAVAFDATLAPDSTNAAPASVQTGEPSAAPLPTPDADTIVLRQETPPPIQESFADLLALNPETVGFLTIGDWMSLPVVQRECDNEFYLRHNFEGENSFAGTLFLDGNNLLVPEDEALIVYGHNMKNGTMLANLKLYERPETFRENLFVHFDTIYENRTYVPFAVFTASAEPEDSAYLNFRQFIFDETTFELYALRMKELSMLSVPVDVRCGDKLLLLVTCEYTHNNGRLIVALRQMRPDETEEDILALAERVKEK